MTDHIHTTITPGCYRCDLGQDEVAAAHAEVRNEAQAAWLTYRDLLLTAGSSRRQLRKREFIAGYLCANEVPVLARRPGDWMSADFNEILDSLQKASRAGRQNIDDIAEKARRRANPKPAATPQLRGQFVGSDYYVRADDLAALLDAKEVMPGLAAALRKKGRSS